MLSNENEKSLITLLIQNKKGVLVKIAGFCTENGMNIEKLVMSSFKSDNKEQKIIMYVTGNRARINSLIETFKTIKEVIDAKNFQSNTYLERELVLVKIKSNSPYLPKITDLVSEYDGRTILVKDKIILFQFTNEEDKNDELTKRIENITDDIEILKTGIVATSLDDNINK